MRFTIVFFTILVLLAAPQTARAGAFPWLARPPVAEDGSRLIVLEDPRIDMALRVELVRHAHKSIRIAVYHQMTDAELGLPLLYALREAADNKVPIQFVTGPG